MVRAHTVLTPGLQRPAILGDYPYYRANPDRWRGNLQELRRQGIDVVSCYIPWRFHEVPTAEGWILDFTGVTDPQRDVYRFLSDAAAAGLTVLAKPGPFINAEVQLGGLPDRFAQPGVHTTAVGLSGRPVTAQGVLLPSFRDPDFRAEVATWMRAVSAEVLAPLSGPHGPIAAVQLGNEGMYGEAHSPVTAQDASWPARTAFARWLGALGLDELAVAAKDEVDRWPAALRSMWSRWCGEDLVEQWAWLQTLLPESITALVNVPLAPVSSEQHALDGWAARTTAIAATEHVYGHTEWVSNPSSVLAGFAAHLFGIDVADTDATESNWGFTWSDAAYADPAAPLFTALLALQLGSGTCSVYTACATQTWGDAIAMSPEGLRSEGIDPALHEPPYCPGAPTTETGAPGKTVEGLRRLRDFLARSGAGLLRSTPVIDATVEIDRRIAEEQAWAPAGGSTVLEQVAATLAELLLQRGLRIRPRWLNELSAGNPSDQPVGVLYRADQSAAEAFRIGIDPARISDEVTKLLARVADAATDRTPQRETTWANRDGRAAVIRRLTADGRTEYVGVFNPTAEPDLVIGASDQAQWKLSLPGHGATILVITDSIVTDRISTPLPGAAQIELDGPADGRPA